MREDKIINFIGDFLKADLSDELITSPEGLKYAVGNSFRYIQLVVALEKEFSFEFDDTDLDWETFESLSNLAAYVCRRCG
ncbi:MAG: phosphopantetheine-binding protein [Spirochaetales bacterium]|nr:phosphopantetheine-binding protein [Spirochaetales bacterium]